MPHHDVFDAASWPQARPNHRYWLHALLLLLTLLTTTIVGAEMAHSFAAGRPFDFETNLMQYLRLWRDPSFLLDGLPFSVTLLTILMAHEMGHYIAARRYQVDATLPFFLPAPTLIGTFGAFIRIRSAILSKRILFDIGVAGPLAGFAMLIVPLIVGVSLSKVQRGIGLHGDFIFGTPLILHFFEWIFFSRRARHRHLSASRGACCLGGLTSHCVKPFAHRATRWRPRSLRIFRRADAYLVPLRGGDAGSTRSLSDFHFRLQDGLDVAFLVGIPADLRDAPSHDH